MRRSSWIILIVAGILLAISAIFYLYSFNSSAPRMNDETANKIVQRGKSSLERGDLQGVMDLFSADARIFDRTREEFRQILSDAIQGSHSGIRVTVHDVSVTGIGGAAEITVSIDLGEQTTKMDAKYYSNVRLHLKLRSIRTQHLFGLYSTEEWEIVEAKSDTSLDVPSANT